MRPFFRSSLRTGHVVLGHISGRCGCTTSAFARRNERQLQLTCTIHQGSYRLPRQVVAFAIGNLPEKRLLKPASVKCICRNCKIIHMQARRPCHLHGSASKQRQG